MSDYKVREMIEHGRCVMERDSDLDRIGIKRKSRGAYICAPAGVHHLYKDGSVRSGVNGMGKNAAFWDTLESAQLFLDKWLVDQAKDQYINYPLLVEQLRTELEKVKKERDKAINLAELSNNLSAEIMINNDHEIEYEYRVNSLADRIAEIKDKD